MRSHSVGEQSEHSQAEELKMMPCKHCGGQMMEYHSMDMRLKDLMMMVLVIHIEEYDMMLHMEKTGMLMLVTEIDVSDMTADDVDKLTYSSDVVKPRQVDLKFSHVST
nr:hypothetical protein [Tanacetum cinerariifolium]